MKRPSLFAGKFVPSCNVFTSHFAKCFFCFPYQPRSFPYRLDGLAGCLKVSSHCMVQSMMSASKRVLAKPKCRKESITPEMLQLLTESLKDKSCIASSRTLALCPIGFAGFLRFSELCSVRLYSSHCSLFLESSKTDQLREGAWINIAKIRQSYMSRCRPLEILSRSCNQAW